MQWLLTSSGRESLPPAGTLHARQSLRFCACHGIVLAYPVRGLRSFVAAAAPRNKCSAAREAREKGEPARAAEGWVRYAHCRLARGRSRELRLRNGERLGNEKSLPCSRGRIRQAQPTQARVVSVCRLRRNQAGRAESSVQIGLYLRPCYGRLPLLRDGGARLCWQRARQPTDAAVNIRDQRAVAASTIEVLRTEHFGRRRRLRRLAAALRLTPQAHEASSFLCEHTSPNPFLVVGGMTAGKEKGYFAAAWPLRWPAIRVSTTSTIFCC